MGRSPRQTDNIPNPENPASTIPDTSTVPNSGGLGTGAEPGQVDDQTVASLMIEGGLDRDSASRVAQIATDVLSQNSTYLNYQQRLPSGESWDVVVRVIPDQVYSPTEAEILKAATTGSQVFDFSSKFEQVGKIPQLTLRYFVPYSSMSDELRATIQSQEHPISASILHSLPRAEASGDASGAVFETIIKGLVSEGINSMGNFGSILSALGILQELSKSGTYSSYFSELDGLLDCVQNPTNPLTKQTYDNNPAERQKAIDGINDAKSDVAEMTAVRMLNLAAKTGAKFTGAGLAGKLLFDSVSKWNDQTLKNATEDLIDDTKKSVVPCKKPKSFDGILEASGLSTIQRCIGPPGSEQCTDVQSEIKVAGTFVLRDGSGTGSTYYLEGTVTIKQRIKETGPHQYHYEETTNGTATIAGGGSTDYLQAEQRSGGILRDFTIYNYGDEMGHTLGLGSAVDPQTGETIPINKDLDTSVGIYCNFNPNVDVESGGKFVASEGASTGQKLDLCTVTLTPADF